MFGISTRAILLSSFAFLSPVQLYAQESPKPEELSAMVEAQMPPFWSLEGFKVVATSDIGDAASPRRVFRFEAESTPEGPLFAETDRNHVFSIVVPTMEVDATRTIYGVLDLGYRAGKWSGEITIENPVTALGLPRDLFAQPTLVMGEEKTNETLAAMRSTAVEETMAAIEKEIAEIKTAHERRMAELTAAQETRVKKAEADYRIRLATLTSENEPLIAEAEAERTTRLAEIRSQTQKALADAKAAAQEAIAETRAAAKQELAKIREANADELDKIRSEHAQKRGNLIEQQRQQMAELETRLGTERASLQKQLDASQEVIALQQELRASMEKRNLGAQELFAAFSEAVKQRTEFLARLPKTWAGTMTCEHEGEPASGVEPFQASRPFYMRIERVNSNGAIIYFDHDEDVLSNGGHIANLNWIDGVAAFPLRFHFIADDTLNFLPRSTSGIRHDALVSITENGVLTGEEQGRGMHRRPKPVDCTFKLSS